MVYLRILVLQESWGRYGVSRTRLLPEQLFISAHYNFLSYILNVILTIHLLRRGILRRLEPFPVYALSNG